MIFSNLQKPMRGGVKYTAPVCEFVEIDTKATFCQSNFETQNWEDEGTDLYF